MKKRILSLAMVLAVVAVLVVPMAALAEDITDSVVCTVSGKLVALTVEDGTVEYGALALEATEDTADAGLDDHQTVTNTGTVQQDFTIKSSDADSNDTVEANDWHLGASVGEVDIFLHMASIADPTSPDWTIAMTDTATYEILKSDVPHTALNTFDFDLQITMPTTVTDYGAHTITVTVLAVEA